MTDSAVKASLATLPPELIDIIFSYSHSLDVPLREYIDQGRLADLRSLSQTCRRLRELVLPLVWTRVEVRTVRQLGLLREFFKEAPSLARLIRSFRFLWNMDGDCSGDKLWVYKQGNTLDLAFRDRLALWNRLMQDRQAKFDDVILYDYRLCEAPGEEPDWKVISEVGVAAYNWRSGKRGRGPDGQGEDSLIKHGKQLIECVTEVVGSLTSLETFGWETRVTPMPREVFCALARLNTLTDLRLIFSTYRDNLSELPFWEISGQLRALSIEAYCENEFNNQGESFGEAEVGVEEVSESTVTAMEGRVAKLIRGVRAQGATDRHAEHQYHLSIASHTIFAAAKGRKLKRLIVDPEMESVFAVRSLVPCWVRIEEWSRAGGSCWSWQAAARALRRFLVHASLRQDWLSTPSNADADLDRRLAYQDMLHLQQYYDIGGQVEQRPFRPTALPAFDIYLPWLTEDAKLCEKVLDVWNSIVERGEADNVKCPCRACKRIYREYDPEASEFMSTRSTTPFSLSSQGDMEELEQE